MKDLTISNIERQSVLNNRFAVKKLQERLDIEGMFFLTSSLRHPKILIKEFSYFLMPCHQHGLRINLLV